MSASPKRGPDSPSGAQALEWVPVPAVIDANGEKVVTLYDERGRPRSRRVAELVLEAFAGPCPPGQELRFKDGDRLNCRLDNLAWADAVPPGTTPVSGPAMSRPVRIDAEGHVLVEGGERVLIPGLEPEAVLRGLADAEAGRVKPLRDVVAGLKDEL